MNHLSQNIQETIDALQHCHAICQSMAMTHCLEIGGEPARPQHLRLMLDCAGLCALTADALGRKSQFHNRLAELCAEVCETCEQDCATLGDMEECVLACRECARRCKEIARLDQAEILAMASRSPPSAARPVGN
jgi:hypothetical protein